MLQGNPYDLDVLVNGHPVTRYIHEGKVYVEGRGGTEYSLRFRNNSHRRVLVIMSVDGLSVMDGEVAKFDSHGYVVAARSSITVPGWRLNNDEVANFKFGGRGKSYAQKSGKPLNIGVIGCAVFEEQASNVWTTFIYTPVVWTTFIYTPVVTCNPCGVLRTTKWTSGSTSGVDAVFTASNAGQDGEQLTSGGNLFFHDVPPTDTRACATDTIQECCDAAPVVQQELGTEFGKRNHHAVQEVAFRHEEQPTIVMEIYYDSRAALEAKGINLSGKQPIARAFPNEQRGGTGCRPPRDWNGSPSR